MATTLGLSSSQWSAIFLICLLGGAEARRVQETTRITDARRAQEASRAGSQAATADEQENLPWGLQVCSYSEDSCRKNAKAQGLSIGGAGWNFAGHWQESGCFAYNSGPYMGMAFYGTAYEGGDIVSESQLTHIPAHDEKFRLEGTHGCQTAEYEEFGVGACRRYTPTDDPASAYNKQLGFIGSMLNCQKRCTADADCKAFEYKPSSHCELHIREPHATSGDATYKCMKKVSSSTSDADLLGIWHYRLNGLALFKDIEREDDKYILTETMQTSSGLKRLTGELAPSGDWLEATMRQDNNQDYGSVRIQLKGGTLVSQFKFPGGGWKKETVARREGSVMRGWLQYKDNVMCTALRKDVSEGGVGLLDLYREQDLEHGCAGKLPNRPHRTLLFRSDDEVMLERHQNGDRLLVTGDKFYWDKDADGDAKEKTMYFSIVKDKLQMRLMGDSTWGSLGSSREAANSWLNVMKMMQSVGVECLQEGTCLTQCTYVESLGECSSDFCTLNKGGWWSSDRPRCTPKVGAQASREGWETLKKRTLKTSQSVLDSGCFGSCQDQWRSVPRNLHLVNELVREFSALDESGTESAAKIPEDMKSLLLDMKTNAPGLSQKAADDLGKTFDYSRKKQGSAAGKTMKAKGCGNMPDGGMQALYRLDASSGKELEEAQAAFHVYTEACPWFKSMASNQDAGIRDAEEAEQQLREKMASANSTSLVEGSSEIIPILDIIIITAVIASIVVIATGIIMVISGVFCSPTTQNDIPVSGNATANFAHKHCAKKHLQVRSSCWSNRVLPGVYTIIGGFVTLTLSGVAVWALAAYGVAAVAGSASAATAGYTVAGIGAAGTTIIGIVQGWMNRIKTSFSDGEELSKEQKYVECMKTFQEGGALPDPDSETEEREQAPDPEESAEETPVTGGECEDGGNRPCGIEQLFTEAHIRTEVMEAFREELLSEGVIAIDEVGCDDWDIFTSHEKMNRFEKKRFNRAVCGEQ